MDYQSQQKHDNAPTFIFDGPSYHQWNDKNDGCFSDCNFFGGMKSIVNRDQKVVDGPKECKDKDDVDRYLAESMKKLTIEDREKALAEVHGIVREKADIEEDSAFMDALLKRVETHLLLIKRGTSYERAERLNQAYVMNRPFRILFLRSNRYDPKPSAEHMIRFFELKEELFGIDKVVREILIEDLDASDLLCLESGCGQVLPHTDRANRQVFLMMPGLRRLCPVEHQLRSHFYLIMTTLRESEEARKNGVVAIIYTIGRFRAMSAGMDATRFAKLVLSLPIPISGIHFCHSDIRQLFLVKSILPFLPLHKTLMVRSHHGTHAEVLYELREYGISDDTLPFSHFDFEGEFMYHYHNMWYQDRKEKDARIAVERRALVVSDFPLGPFDIEDPITIPNIGCKSTNESNDAVESTRDPDEGKLSPRPQDVLFGYGYKLHPGNTELHKLIEQHADDYAEAKRKKEKMEYVTNLVIYMKNRGSRFLIFEKELKGWVEVPDSQARKKVAKTIRNRRRKRET